MAIPESVLQALLRMATMLSLEKFRVIQELLQSIFLLYNRYYFPEP